MMAMMEVMSRGRENMLGAVVMDFSCAACDGFEVLWVTDCVGVVCVAALNVMVPGFKQAKFT